MTIRTAFTPSMITQDELERLLVGSEHLVDSLVDRLRESVATGAKHHVLLVGPAGAGKTHLVSLLYHRLKVNADLTERLIVAWLREEEWGVSSLLSLLTRILRALESELQDPSLAAAADALRDMPAAKAEDAAGKLLKHIVGERTLLLVVENLDALFAGLQLRGQQRLRAYLQENPICDFVATSTTLFNGVSLQSAPFYGFFQIEPVEELALDEARLLLVRAAEVGGDYMLAAFIETPVGRARVRAIYHLAGGIPRFYIILSQFLTRDSLDNLVRPFMQMLDNLTPYYNSRLELLSQQQREIIEFLCDRSIPVPVKEIARHCFASAQTVSGQLRDLRENRCVVSHKMGREERYEIAEPMMRLCMDLKKDRGESIRFLLDFLRFWYGAEEIQRLKAEDVHSTHLHADLLDWCNRLSRMIAPERAAARNLRSPGVCISQPILVKVVHLINIAILYGETRDPSLLLGHSAEERGLVEQLLGKDIETVSTTFDVD